VVGITEVDLRRGGGGVYLQGAPTLSGARTGFHDLGWSGSKKPSERGGGPSRYGAEINKD